ncbi:MAG TPA: hypothetical protein VGH90_00345, partial [Chthoniobacteraceae bacterium]
MSALVKKEIRLLLPTWIGCIALTLLAACLLPHDAEARSIAVGLSCIVLAAASYGREFSCGTFTLLLSQPVSRKRIWKMKTAVLAAAFSGLGIAILAGQSLASADPLAWRGIDVLFLFAAVAGGFSAALLVRQIFAAFWLAWLTPLAIYALVLLASLCFRSAAIDPNRLFIVPLAIYTAFSAWWSWRLYSQAEDLPSLGEKIVELGWPWLRNQTANVSNQRRPAPFRALLAKEFRLNFLGFSAMAGLFLSHLVLRAMLRLPHDPTKPAWSVLHLIVDAFWMAWLPIPVLMGSASVAEERRLGTLQSQFCIPSARFFSFS